ncbi:hypothetical protein CDL15_Pgr014001 [Punica granatum]|uniref:Uncharacterized protein n=1 Tax=Punica granatum TaxID=22663 RepID=A0A218WB22_PUNGR|nr:hypothetical protein CDL15_Pgr014001 [Punica granatum]
MGGRGDRNTVATVFVRWRLLGKVEAGEGTDTEEGERRGTGLAGLRTIAVRLAGGGSRRKKSRKRPVKVKDKLMDWWHKMVFPVRRLWFAVSTRVKSREKGAGLLKLHDDVQTCGYEDVQVMWEMLRRSETETMAPNHGKRKQRPFWRVFVWSNHNAASSLPGHRA